MTMIDDKPFDYLIGNMEGDKEYVIDKPSLNFSKYLYLQIDNLVDICYNELISIYQPK